MKRIFKLYTGTEVKIYFNTWFLKFPLFWLAGIIIGRRVFLCYKEGNSMADYYLNHEMIHQLQMEKYGVCKFYKMYIMKFFKNCFKYFNPGKAYKRISFEIEAVAKIEKWNSYKLNDIGEH